MPTIDDTVNPHSPPGFALSANVTLVPNYLSGTYLPDGSVHIKSLSPQTMAPDVSFDFPAPQVYHSRPVPGK